MNILQRKKMALMSCLNFRGYKRTATGLPLNLIASMFLSKLTIYGNTEQRNLPEGYTQVEYLQSTGTQWIVTGIYPSNNTKVEVVFSTSYKPDQFLYGARTVITNPEEGHYTNVCLLENIIYCGFDTNNQPYDCTYNSDKNTVVNSQDGLYLNGTLITTYAEATFTSQRSMYLFGLHEGSSVEPRKFNGKIYSFKTYESGTLTHDLVPCTRDTDSKPGMYDTMTDTFMTNAGTGEFTAGAEVAGPTPDNPIDVQLCGDRTANLFDEQWKQGNLYGDENVHDTRISSTFTMPIKSGETYSAKVFESGYRISLAINKYSTPTWGAIIVDTGWQNDFATITGTADGYMHISLSRPNETALSYTEAPKVMLAKGLYTAETMPDYEPYGYKINGEVIGENLFDVNDQNTGNFDGTVDDDDWITVTYDNSASTQNPYRTVYTDVSNNIKPSTAYKIVTEIQSIPTGCNICAVSNDTGDGQFTNTIIYNETGIYTAGITSVSNFANAITMLRTFCTYPPGTSGTFKFRISVLPADVDTSNYTYQPYNLQQFNVYTPSQIGKVDSAVDEIVLDKENKTAELTRQYRRYDFTGTENWTIEYATGYGDDGKRFAMVADVPYSGRKKTPNNRFSTTTDNVHINNIMFSSAYNIYLYMSACSTVDELKTYLQNNPTYAYIPYSTPQTTDITALQDWDSMPDVKGTVTLTLSAEVEPSEAEAVYYSKERNTE